MSTLKTDYKQDILAPSMDGKRKFNLVDSEGNIVVSNVHIEDVSSYSQVGDEFNADVINGQNEAINKNASDISEINTHLSSLIVSETIVGTAQTITPAANTKFTLNCSKAGYKVLSFNVINTGTTLFDIVAQSLGNNSITIVVDNIDSTSHGFTPKIEVWYIKE